MQIVIHRGFLRKRTKIKGNEESYTVVIKVSISSVKKVVAERTPGAHHGESYIQDYVAILIRVKPFYGLFQVLIKTIKKMICIDATENSALK